MSIALFGASTLVLQHKEHVTSLLGLGTSDLVWSLGLSSIRSLSAAAVLLLQGYLIFKRANPLLKTQLQKSGKGLAIRTLPFQLKGVVCRFWKRQDAFHAGLNLAKMALIWVAVSMAVYRCQQECEPGAFVSLEQLLYRFQWYLRLFAAAAIMYGTVLALLSGMKSSASEQTPAADPDAASNSAQKAAQNSAQSGAQGDVTQPVVQPPVQSLWPDAVNEAAGLQGRLESVCGGHAAVLLRFGITPALLLLLCAWWLPQHPMLRRLHLG